MLRERLSIGAREARSYGGRRVCADTDLHERAVAHLSGRLPAGGAVADVGCGQGAFSARLADAGFRVVGIDVVPPEDTAGFAFEQVDLFERAARDAFLARHAGSFDAVALMEVIEHVHDPWETLAFCRALLRPGGTLFLSTPNVTSFFSRFRFLTGGRMHQFEPPDLAYGHINPMTALMVETVLRETGFELLDKRPGPRMPVLVWDSAVRPLSARAFHALSWLVAACLTPLMRGGDLDGWSLFFTARRAG